ncbi:hypothetical protein [Kitasatospora griseola]|uniref:hypothetical protein n=1 Tax=Kitasatospora griseola TaxID=2064 RepID=UPI00167141F6|nr:hypothetical protein [Kitasatospora griseola]GGQ88982.1 hypothetical protein GCM10010195_50920 [Kitasatospora griseola]
MLRKDAADAGRAHKKAAASRWRPARTRGRPLKVDPALKDPQAVRAALIELCETELVLEPGDLAAIDIAEAILARAAQLSAVVKREGRVIPGGNRAGMMVLHPGVAQAQTNRSSAAGHLAKIRGEGEGPKRGHNVRDAVGARWGNRA